MARKTKAEREAEEARKSEMHNEEVGRTYRAAVEEYADLEFDGDPAAMAEVASRLTSAHRDVQVVTVVRAGSKRMRVEPVEPRQARPGFLPEVPSYPPAAFLKGFVKGFMEGGRESRQLREELDRARRDLSRPPFFHPFAGPFMMRAGF